MKTAMQELIEWMDDNKAHCTYGTIRGKATELLAKEKQYIIDAHTEGQALIINILNERLNGQFVETFTEIEKARNGDNDIKATGYFTQKYKQ